MKTMTAQRESTCTRCWAPIDVGTTIDYDPEARTATHADCVARDRPEPEGELKLAVDYLKGLEAPGEFEASLLEQYARKGQLSPKQIAAVLRRILDRDLPGPEVVPAGKYALPMPEELGGEGYFFVKVWRAPRNPRMVRCYLLDTTQQEDFDFDGEQVEMTIEPKDTLARIIDFGPAESAILYGRRSGRCSICSKALTAALSRKLAIGPKCGPRFYDETAWMVKRTEAQLWLMKHGIDPKAELPLDFDLEQAA